MSLFPLRDGESQPRSARSDGERSEPERSADRVADPEVLEKPERRRFSAEYKLKIVEEAERCVEPGEVGALLRREGLYSSHLANWRKQYREGALHGLRDSKRGRKTKPRNPLSGRVQELERDKRKLEKKVRQLELMVEVQKKVSEMLGIDMESPEDADGRTS